MVDISRPRLFANGEFIARILVFSCAVAVIVFCSVAISRGFEISDESYYILLGIYPGAVRLYISAQHWVLAPLWSMTGSLISFRAAGFLILLASSAVLALGVQGTLTDMGVRTTKRDTSLIVCSSIIGALLYISTINLSPSYNLLAGSGTYAGAGFSLLALRERGWLSRAILLALSGLALCVVFVCKPSAGIAVILVLSFWMIVFSRTLRGGVDCVVVFGFCFAIAVPLLAASQSTFSEIPTALASGYEMFRMVQTELIGDRLVRYIMDFRSRGFEMMAAFWPVIICIGLYLITRRLPLVVIVFALLALTLVYGDFVLGGLGQYPLQIKAAAFLLIAALAVAAPVWARDRRTGALIVGLVGLPYATAFGTGNSMFTQVIVSLAPWGVAIAAVAVIEGSSSQADRLLSLGLLAAFGMTIASQIVTSGFRAPYRLGVPLWEQTTWKRVGNLGMIQVDDDTAKFIDAINAASEKCRIVPGAPYVGLYDIPGVSLALRAVPTITPWINNLKQAERVMTLAPAGLLSSAIVAIRYNPEGNPVEKPIIPDSMASFPDKFKFCGEAIYPYDQQRIGIWSATPDR